MDDPIEQARKQAVVEMHASTFAQLASRPTGDDLVFDEAETAFNTDIDGFVLMRVIPRGGRPMVFRFSPAAAGDIAGCLEQCAARVRAGA